MQNFYLALLNANQRYCYQILESAVRAKMPSYNAPNGLSAADINAVNKAFTFEHPEICYFPGIETSISGNSVRLRYLNSDQGAFERKVDEVFNQIRRNLKGKTDEYSIVKEIYEYITLNYTYNHKLFDERLKYFNHENDYLISYSELPKGGDLITNRSLPNPAEISVKDGKVIKTHLLKNAKVNFEFVYKLCDLIITDGTLRAIEKNLNISYKTAIFRRFKIFVAIEDYIKHLKLKNFVYFDEIFVKLINPDSDYKKEWDAKKKGHSSAYYGKVTVAIGCDSNGTVICKKFSESAATRSFYKFYYKDVVEPKSTLISDMHSGASELIEPLNLSDHRVKSDYNDPEIMEVLQPINSLSNSAKAFLENKHRGIKDENMQDYLNLFSLKQTLLKHNYSHNEQVIFLVELLYSSTRELKFNDIFSR